MIQCYKLCCRIVVGALETKRKGHEFSMDFDGSREVVMAGKVFGRSDIGFYVSNTIDSGPAIAVYPGAPFNENNCLDAILPISLY